MEECACIKHVDSFVNCISYRDIKSKIMNRIIVVLIIFSVLAACSKDKEQADELPKWLQERISIDEDEIAADPQSYKTLGAWIRYNYSGAIYFEYHNLIFSSFPKVHNYDSTEMIYSGTEYTEYQKNKCCKKFVWKGSSYVED